MEAMVIQGGNRLEGALTLQGAKNSVLPMLAASLLFRRGCLLHNCPALSDVATARATLEHLGCRVFRQGHSILVDTAGLCRTDIPRTLMEKMRSSVLFLGPLLARTGRCSLYQPGGCQLGSRPIDLHLMGLKAMGAEISQEGDRIDCRGRLRGAAITLPYPSVGATENLILAALGAEGTTTLYNAAREPEIGDLIAFLKAGGGEIYGAGTSMLQIQGGLLTWAAHEVMPDRMEAATFLCAAAATGGSLCLRRARPEHLTPVLQTLERAGCRIRREADGLCLLAPERLTAPPPVRTAPYPGFPTDAQAPVMAAVLRARGITVFEETVFDHRYRHVPALRQMGASVETEGAVAVVTGVPRLTAADMEATDLRGGAAMAVAALSAEGRSCVSGMEHILRGYEDFPRRLALLGGDVTMDCGGTHDGLGATGNQADWREPPPEPGDAARKRPETPPCGGAGEAAGT